MPPKRRTKIPRGLREQRNERTALQQAGIAGRRAIKKAPQIVRSVDASAQDVTRAELNRDMTYDLALKIIEAKSGNDSELLPYQPTPSINPPRPRTLAAGYDKDTSTLFIRFRDGAIYAYKEVSPREYRNFTRVKSPGRFVNRVLNAKEYTRLPWAS